MSVRFETVITFIIVFRIRTYANTYVFALISRFHRLSMLFHQHFTHRYFSLRVKLVVCGREESDEFTIRKGMFE